jgi:polar amino acid transport system substrate-binding protein
VRLSNTTTSRRNRVFRTAMLGAALAGALAVSAACSSSGSTSNSPTPSTSASSSVDAALAAQVPAKLKTSGKVVVCTDATYAPNEFVGTDGKTIQGMDVDLGKAIGEVLGVSFDFQNLSFDSIIPSLGSRCDLGMSSFTDTLERQKTVNFVDYFSAGTSFMMATAHPVTQTLKGTDGLCGFTVAVEKGTTQADDAAAAAKTCEANGLKTVTVLVFTDQNAANLALTSGRAQLGMADSPVAGYIAKQSGGAITLTGNQYGTAPYGIAVPKGADYTGFDTAIQGALQKLAANGTYTKILTTWNVQNGAITTFTINGGTS